MQKSTEAYSLLSNNSMTRLNNPCSNDLREGGIKLHISRGVHSHNPFLEDDGIKVTSSRGKGSGKCRIHDWGSCLYTLGAVQLCGVEATLQQPCDCRMHDISHLAWKIFQVTCCFATYLLSRRGSWLGIKYRIVNLAEPDFGVEIVTLPRQLIPKSYERHSVNLGAERESRGT